jgi:uncharacterized membrane protein
MKNRKSVIRTMLAAAAFAAVLGFGASQVIATELDNPGTQSEGCTSTLCKKDCPEFGSDPRWNGRKWVCYCCG